MKKILILAALLFAAALPAHAQFIGYQSPQTVIQKVFGGQTTTAVTPPNSTLPCPTNGNPCAIPNLGQSIHSVTYTISSPCSAGFSMIMRIEASNDGTNWFAISEDATDQNSGTVQGSTFGGLTAIGSYAAFRLNLSQFQCVSGQTPAITAAYSGTSTSTPTAVGTFYQSGPYRKPLLLNSPTTSGNTVVTVNTPTGNSGGGLYASCFLAATGAATGCPLSMAFTVNVLAAFSSVPGTYNTGGTIVTGTGGSNFPPGSNPIAVVPSFPATQISFTLGGAGTAGTNWSVYYVSNSAPSANLVNDPCESSGATKQFSQFTITTATTTGMVAAVTGKSIYVCGVTAQLNSTTASTFFLEYGTGASCAGGPTALTATYTNSTLVSEVVNFSELGVVPLGNGLCVVSTVGTGPSIPVSITFVQQ